MSSVEAKTAARWWADNTFRKTPRFDNGDDSEVGAFGQILTIAGNASLGRPTDEQVERFEEALAVSIDLALGEDATARYGVTIGVDYHPDQLLVGAAEEAGIVVNDLLSFPWKTRMEIRQGRVIVAAGYGASSEEVPLA